LAELFGTEKFRKYIEHQEFILETDNQALLWLLSHPRQLGKIGRWVVRISSLNFEVRHIRGTLNIVADTLSRMFEPSQEQEQAQVSCRLTLTSFPLVFQDLAKLQREDVSLADTISRLEKGDKVGSYTLRKDVLYCRSGKGGRPKLVVPETAVPMVFTYHHDSPLGDIWEWLRPLVKFVPISFGPI
jgi:hypothetical protein